MISKSIIKLKNQKNLLHFNIKIEIKINRIENIKHFFFHKTKKYFHILSLLGSLRETTAYRLPCHNRLKDGKTSRHDETQLRTERFRRYQKAFQPR